MSVSADSRTVILTPLSPLANGTIYKISLETYYYPTDLVGNYLDNYFSSTFTTVP